LFYEVGYKQPKAKNLTGNPILQERENRENNTLISIKENLRKVLNSNDTSVNLDGSSFLTVLDKKQNGFVTMGKGVTLIEKLRRGEL
jgi:hypothetical protein